MSVQAVYVALLYRGVPAKAVHELILESSRYRL
jgi:hypothetical protein